jgi:hypothetical protein
LETEPAGATESGARERILATKAFDKAKAGENEKILRVIARKY